ncbi:MAG: membrane biogenesis protein [Candidatus Portnoybacteria bacterium CG06_land_8_20_14_3_00_39_12]|uniref:Membrane biogenesis protein n=1 Tax=Candidatus Portnoybacteria bacterium CG06_land_8_20_14_3_00_39_12 TaxID=1974809 RepID=A0A2M7AY46_9BACT|nr:MAG: membrane biogenesis protein [Candidatus Portnoybacteria bacterium CG06_land_8_20_14_3_00_39_12]
MQYKISKIFDKKNKKIIIGVIHFPPLLGYREFPGFEVCLDNAIEDLQAFEKGGVDAVIIENNYDIPHKIKVGPETVAAMTFLGKEIAKNTKLPLGVSVLWNDFEAALAIAKVIGAKFIRVPAFVDRVKTDYGIAEGNAKEVLVFRKKISAENIALFTDIQVKHAKLLKKRPIEESALEAIKLGSDGLIITGKWTGQAPEIEKLEAVRKAVGDFPIFVGSGADKDNLKSLFKYANGAIVSTSLKRGSAKKSEVNVKNWKQRINKFRVKEIVRVSRV